MTRDVAPALAELDAGAALTRWVLENARRPEDASLEALDEDVFLALVEVLLKRGHLRYAALAQAAARRLALLDPTQHHPAGWITGTLTEWRDGFSVPTFGILRNACRDALSQRPGAVARAVSAGLSVLGAGLAGAPHAAAVYMEELLDAFRDHYGDDRAFEALRADPQLTKAITAGLAEFLR